MDHGDFEPYKSRELPNPFFPCYKTQPVDKTPESVNTGNSERKVQERGIDNFDESGGLGS